MVKPGLPAEECLDLDTNCDLKWGRSYRYG